MPCIACPVNDAYDPRRYGRTQPCVSQSGADSGGGGVEIRDKTRDIWATQLPFSRFTASRMSLASIHRKSSQYMPSAVDAYDANIDAGSPYETYPAVSKSSHRTGKLKALRSWNASFRQRKTSMDSYASDSYGYPSDSTVDWVEPFQELQITITSPTTVHPSHSQLRPHRSSPEVGRNGLQHTPGCTDFLNPHERPSWYPDSQVRSAFYFIGKVR